ncbi:prepilin-type N-terminal cleavage/methylation domain-containing protein [Salmonella enterica subsp. enterica serovar Poona]|nr:prepilin-type N-terminal cleavage/methylation domain-containing protein [Salmonella enterica subsp. enterica serovar Poona]HEB6949294.1 prepilin-type N-terminal cleavage/methylation domain-containing protein [Salmonella enterica subsp. enterica serovar Hvittingfoss]
MKINSSRLRNTRQNLILRLDKLKRQRGMTLLEIIIVLGIIGVIAAGVVILAQRAYDTKAMTDLANNANTIRSAVKDAYGPSGAYPAANNAATIAMTTANYTTNASLQAPVAKLIALGKLSVDEAQNNISGNFISIGPGKIGAKDDAGYYIALNGLNAQQCRGLLNQMANNWDYVQVVDDSPAGSYNGDDVQLDAAATAITAGTAAAEGIFRSLDSTTGAKTITPDMAVMACSDNSSNALILGSR